MASSIEATLHVSLQTAQVYRVLYTVSNGHGGAATPYSIHGQETLRAFLTQCAIAPETIDVLIARVEAGTSYVLDLAHLDQDHITSLLRGYTEA